MINTNFIDEFMSKNLQFPDNFNDSDLWKSIKMAFECTSEEAQTFAKYHCNSLSFYCLCRSRGFIEFHYNTWCKLLLDNGLMTKRGYIGDNTHNKLDVAELFGFEKEFDKLIYHYDYNECMSGKGLNPDKGYNIKVYANSGKGFHFMAGYIKDGLLYLSDSGNRGIQKKARSVITKNKFLWILEV